MLNSLKEDILEMRSQSTATKKKQIKNFNCSKISNFRNGIKEIFKVIQRRKSRMPSKGSSFLISSGHEVHDPFSDYFPVEIKQGALKQDGLLDLT